ncbi:hypothetical protein [Mycoplasma sp. 1012]
MWFIFGFLNSILLQNRLAEGVEVVFPLVVTLLASVTISRIFASSLRSLSLASDFELFK